MNVLCTKDKQAEIVELANSGHAEAIIAFGADRHLEGIIDGSVTALVGFIGVSLAIKSITRIMKHILKRRI